MYKVLQVKKLTSGIYLFKLQAPQIARKARAGQFIILRIDQEGERIPLTIADWDVEEGSITIVFMAVGTTTCSLSRLKPGDAVADLAGPLGHPTEIERFGTVVCVAGGFAIAVIRPIIRSLKQAGNRIVTIVGVRNKDLMFWEKELRQDSDELIITTDDGSYQRKGLVTEPLKEILDSGEPISRVIAIGPTAMMKFTSLTTRPYAVKTIVSLNPIMVDGTGMCGCCRVSVGDETKFACVEGPEFDGHLVDWDEFMSRQTTYLDQEKYSYQCTAGEQQGHRS
ncbi:MAG: sulfide/dihydroorotate dehydrogenase-like FAD/NAD-binding protein [Dehalococcoidaceae bacterium]|nr:sulfide/dihydroorotate dehydrogenase-like FAD/NAD-binding protein [Dehalococcoidaceae bacterium]